MSSALTAPTPDAELVFSLNDSERVSAAVRQLADKSGLLTVELLTFTTRTEFDVATESYILAAGITDDGDLVDGELAEHILDLRCIETRRLTSLDVSGLAPMLEQQMDLYTEDVQNRTAQFSLDQGDLVESRLKDHKAKYDAEARKLEKTKEEINARERRATDLTERLKLRKDVQRLARQADELYENYREERDRLRAKADTYIEMLEHSLQAEVLREGIFSVRWKVMG